jgi:hypothetical protein
VPIEHQAPSPTRPLQSRDRLESARLDLLEIDCVTARGEKLGKPPRQSGLLGLEAWNPDQVTSQLDQSGWIDVIQQSLLH